MYRREIKQEETEIIQFLLKSKNMEERDFPISHDVTDYEGAVMRSIGLGNENSVYQGDIVQVKYVDSDQIPVVITLTKDTNNQLLDLDFWKEDFSALVKYPVPVDLELIS